MTRHVVRRDGTVVPFNADRICIAIRKALNASEQSPSVAESLTGEVVSKLPSKSDYCSIEEIQDTVELILMSQYPTTAKAYILYRYKQLEIRKTVPKLPTDSIKTPWGPLGSIIFYRTYSRRIDSGDRNSKMESYDHAVTRILTACENQLECKFTREELARLRYFLLSMKCLPGGRFLWQLGTKTVDRNGITSLQNCAFRAIDSIETYPWLMDLAMLGVGIGFSVSKRHICSLPSVLDIPIRIRRVMKSYTKSEKDDVSPHDEILETDVSEEIFVVHDSREGWVSLLRKTLEAFFVTGKSFCYTTEHVRPLGELLKGFGGIASGPEPLVSAITKIKLLLQSFQGRKLTSLGAHDIACMISEAVVAGNIRRVAAISIGDPDDIEFLQAKTYTPEKPIPSYRYKSNNTVYCDDISELPQEYWDLYKTGCEAYGLFNLRLAKEVGRIKDGNKYPDPSIEGVNPCAEQGLASGETCCLAELFLPNIVSKEELFEAARLIYRVCKHSLLLPCHHKITQDIVRKNMRMGIGVTGYLQATEEQRCWLDETYVKLRALDEEYSMMHNLTISVKLTTVKPGGTTSSMAGVTSGCHPGMYPYYIRRIRISHTSELVNECKKRGYKVEDDIYDKGTAVVEFPSKAPEGTILAKDMSIIDQLEVVRRLQTEWSDNNVSFTGYYDKEEDIPKIKEYLQKYYRDNFKTCSFNMRDGGKYAQLPYEEITKEQYDEMIAKCEPIDTLYVDDTITPESELDMECRNGMCPIK